MLIKISKKILVVFVLISFLSTSTYQKTGPSYLAPSRNISAATLLEQDSEFDSLKNTLLELYRLDPKKALKDLKPRFHSLLRYALKPTDKKAFEDSKENLELLTALAEKHEGAALLPLVIFTIRILENYPVRLELAQPMIELIKRLHERFLTPLNWKPNRFSDITTAMIPLLHLMPAGKMRTDLIGLISYMHAKYRPYKQAKSISHKDGTLLISLLLEKIHDPEKQKTILNQILLKMNRRGPFSDDISLLIETVNAHFHSSGEVKETLGKSIELPINTEVLNVEEKIHPHNSNRVFYIIEYKLKVEDDENPEPARYLLVEADLALEKIVSTKEFIHNVHLHFLKNGGHLIEFFNGYKSFVEIYRSNEKEPVAVLDKMVGHQLDRRKEPTARIERKHLISHVAVLNGDRILTYGVRGGSTLLHIYNASGNLLPETESYPKRILGLASLGEGGFVLHYAELDKKYIQVFKADGTATRNKISSSEQISTTMISLASGDVLVWSRHPDENRDEDAYDAVHLISANGKMRRNKIKSSRIICYSLQPPVFFIKKKKRGTLYIFNEKGDSKTIGGYSGMQYFKLSHGRHVIVYKDQGKWFVRFLNAELEFLPDFQTELNIHRTKKISVLETRNGSNNSFKISYKEKKKDQVIDIKLPPLDLLQETKALPHARLIDNEDRSEIRFFEEGPESGKAAEPVVLNSFALPVYLLAAFHLGVIDPFSWTLILLAVLGFALYKYSAHKAREQSESRFYVEFKRKLGANDFSILEWNLNTVLPYLLEMYHEEAYDPEYVEAKEKLILKALYYLLDKKPHDVRAEILKLLNKSEDDVKIEKKQTLVYILIKLFKRSKSTRKPVKTYFYTAADWASTGTQMPNIPVSVKIQYYKELFDEAGLDSILKRGLIGGEHSIYLACALGTKGDRRLKAVEELVRQPYQNMNKELVEHLLKTLVIEAKKNESNLRFRKAVSALTDWHPALKKADISTKKAEEITQIKFDYPFKVLNTKVIEHPHNPNLVFIVTSFYDPKSKNSADVKYHVLPFNLKKKSHEYRSEEYLQEPYFHFLENGSYLIEGQLEKEYRGELFFNKGRSQRQIAAIGKDYTMKPFIRILKNNRYTSIHYFRRHGLHPGDTSLIIRIRIHDQNGMFVGKPIEKEIRGDFVKERLPVPKIIPLGGGGFILDLVTSEGRRSFQAYNPEGAPVDPNKIFRPSANTDPLFYELEGGGAVAYARFGLTGNKKEAIIFNAAGGVRDRITSTDPDHEVIPAHPEIPIFKLAYKHPDDPFEFDHYTFVTSHGRKHDLNIPVYHNHSFLTINENESLMPHVKPQKAYLFLSYEQHQWKVVRIAPHEKEQRKPMIIPHVGGPEDIKIYLNEEGEVMISYLPTGDKSRKSIEVLPYSNEPEEEKEKRVDVECRDGNLFVDIFTDNESAPESVIERKSFLNETKKENKRIPEPVKTGPLEHSLSDNALKEVHHMTPKKTEADKTETAAANLEPSLVSHDAGLTEVESKGIAVGKKLNGYEIIELIGSGGMGKVFKARETASGKLFAVKVVPVGHSLKAKHRFEREAKTLLELKHPHIVKALKYGFEGNQGYVVMPLEEKNLADVLAELRRQKRGYNAARVKEITRQIAGALAYAHSKGVLHRDIKPSNILIDSTGNVKLADFGLVKSVEGSALTRVGAVVGTIAYMAPEQAINEESEKSDIYPVGLILLELLIGSLPLKENKNSTRSYLEKQQLKKVISELRNILYEEELSAEETFKVVFEKLGIEPGSAQRELTNMDVELLSAAIESLHFEPEKRLSAQELNTEIEKARPRESIEIFTAKKKAAEKNGEPLAAETVQKSPAAKPEVDFDDTSEADEEDFEEEGLELAGFALPLFLILPFFYSTQQWPSLFVVYGLLFGVPLILQFYLSMHSISKAALGHDNEFPAQKQPRMIPVAEPVSCDFQDRGAAIVGSFL